MPRGAARSLDGMMNTPGRLTNRPVIGDSFPKQAEQGKATENYRLDNFNRPNGYHLTQPSVAPQLGRQAARQSPENSFGTMAEGSESIQSPPKKRRSKRRLIKGLVTIILIIGLMIVVYKFRSSLHFHKLRVGFEDVKQVFVH